MGKHLKILLVEDSEDDAFFLLHYLRQDGYITEDRRVENAAKFRQALDEEVWDVIVSDFNLPQFNGLAALEIYRGYDIDTPFLVVSGTIGEETAVEMMKAGAQDYLMKENLTRLAPAIQRALEEAKVRQERREAIIKLRESEARYRAVVEDQTELICRYSLDGVITFVNEAFARFHGKKPDEIIGSHIKNVLTPEDIIRTGRNRAILFPKKSTVKNEIKYSITEGEPQWLLWHDRLILDIEGKPFEFQGVGHDITQLKLADEALRKSEEQLRQANVELEFAYDTTLEGWAKALELRDKETEGHSRSVTRMTVKLAEAMGFQNGMLIHIRRGALLHDIGKMGIPDSILQKPGPLTEEEWAIMRKHPIYAFELLSTIDFLKPALEIPYYHHERWDGSGYPHGLVGSQIPLSARIFSVVDCWDALRSDRPYREAWPEDKVYRYLGQEAGVQFDPEIVSIFLEMISITTQG